MGARTPTGFANIHEFCRSVVESGDLESKLQAPRAAKDAPLEDAQPGPSLVIDAPTRAPELALGGGSGRLPVLHELVNPEARTACLARFAYHVGGDRANTPVCIV